HAWDVGGARAVEPEQGLLEDIIRLVAPPREAQTEAVEPPRKHVVQLVEGGRLARGVARHEAIEPFRVRPRRRQRDARESLLGAEGDRVLRDGARLQSGHLGEKPSSKADLRRRPAMVTRRRQKKKLHAWLRTDLPDILRAELSPRRALGASGRCG